jgi:transcriptional regulator with XRE-family HTH domain
LPFASVSRKCRKPKETDFGPQTIGEHVKKRRLQLKLTQKAVARLLGVTQFSVINWERGDFQPRRARTLARIIAFLGYDPLPPGVTIPERLREKRRQLGWGQQELAQHLAVDRCTVASWEAGGIVMAKCHRELLARFLGMPADELDPLMRKRWNDAHNRPAPDRLQQVCARR